MSRVAVLKGGRSLERQVSLRSGARVQDALERLGHEVLAIDVGPELVSQLMAGRPDVAFVALHGRDGEDGTVQELLEVMGIRYTGSGVSACISAADKVLAKHAMRDRGIPTPDFYAFNETAFGALGAAQALPAIEERLEFPIVVKPARQGSALGIKFARTTADVPAALTSSISSLASAMSWRRCFGSRFRHLLSKSLIFPGVRSGSALQSGSPLKIAASVSLTVSPSNARLPASIS